MTFIAEASASTQRPHPTWAIMLVSPVLAALYPLPLIGFHMIVSGVKADSLTYSPSVWFIAAALLVVAFAVPAVSLVAAANLSRITRPTIAEVRARRVAFLAVAAPAHFSFVGTTTFMLGVSAADKWVLAAYWAIWATYVATGSHTKEAPSPRSPVAGRVRVAHGIIALVVLAGFLMLHLANHLVGLESPDAHTTAMKVLRHIYRTRFTEPTLMAGFAALAASGAYLAWKCTRVGGDWFRTMQITTGVYLLFFLISHSSAVFVLARTYLGIETDWGFATGAPTGLIFDAWNIRLVPLYALGAFCAIAHPFFGARIVMLSHGIRRDTADSIAKLGTAVAGLVASLIILGMCGLRLQFL